ncbi:GH12 family glycosyl hydrolase domain-containing protein [Streptacidiphilus cavernicola]|uniref:Cellulose binding domain-containing protein n=1 Tax=Streptacidiphilus cavernicola TaxID=3342716 RepID=A0ABV6W3B7_9ACTN
MRHPHRPFRRTRAATAVAALLAALLIPFAGATGAQAADTTTCAPQGTLPVDNGEYTLQANEWNSSAQQCITSSGGTAWSVSTANFNLGTSGAPATYPSLYKGCHWGACTTGSNLPIQISNLGSATSSWSTVQPASGAYDVAYDLWINSTPTTSGQPDGTEIMIWLNSRGGVQPFGSQTGTSTAAGHNWNVWTGQQTSWKIISYVLQGGGTSFSNLDVKALINDAVSRGSVNPAHYLIDAEAGFEVWQGGQGLGTSSFSFDATAGSNSGGGGGGGTGGGGTGGSAGCTAALNTDNQWNSGFTDTVTVTNTGSAPTKGWTVGWTWPNGQQVTGSWNATLSQSGSAVTASGLSYNSAIAPAASTSFGFQGTWTGSNGAPTLSCTAS